MIVDHSKKVVCITASNRVPFDNTHSGVLVYTIAGWVLQNLFDFMSPDSSVQHMLHHILSSIYWCQKLWIFLSQELCISASGQSSSILSQASKIRRHFTNARSSKQLLYIFYLGAKPVWPIAWNPVISLMRCSSYVQYYIYLRQFCWWVGWPIQCDECLCLENHLWFTSSTELTKLTCL